MADCSGGTCVAVRPAMLNSLASALGVAILATGCATPLPVVRLQPQGSEWLWVSGRAVATRAGDGIRTAAAFDHQDGTTVVFRVEVQNESEARIDVDPGDMLYTICVDETTCSARQPVADPEQM